jgi:hypothetical protein
VHNLPGSRRPKRVDRPAKQQGRHNGRWSRFQQDGNTSTGTQRRGRRIGSGRSAVARQRTSGETSAEINLVQDVRRSRTNPVTLVVRVKRTANVRENLLDDAQEPHRIVVVEAADGLPHSAGKTGSERPEGSRPRIQGSRDTHTHTQASIYTISK